MLGNSGAGLSCFFQVLLSARVAGDHFVRKATVIGLLHRQAQQGVEQLATDALFVDRLLGGRGGLFLCKRCASDQAHGKGDDGTGAGAGDDAHVQRRRGALIWHGMLLLYGGLCHERRMDAHHRVTRCLVRAGESRSAGLFQRAPGSWERSGYVCCLSGR